MSALSRFASAFSLGPKAATKPAAEDPKKETDEEKKSRRAADRARKAGESDEDYAKRCAELDDKEKAEDDKEKPGDKDDKDGNKGDKTDDEKCAIARAEGIKAERARWSATLADPRAANRGMYACQLLDTTELDSNAILATVATFPEQGGSAAELEGLAARMEAVRAANPAPAPGTGSQPVKTGSAVTADAIIAAADKVRGLSAKPK